MAAKTGVGGLVKVASNTVAEINGFTVEESANTISNTNLNDTAESSIAGRTSWSATIECFWDKSDTTGQGALAIGASVSVVLQPEGDTSGDETLTGTAIVTSASKTIADEAMTSRSFSLQGVGALVVGTVA